MSLPIALIDKVKKGEVALLLGSGALYGAKLPDEKKIPLGDGLKNLLCDEFLSGGYKDENLAYVSQIAISETSLFDVQEFIKEYFEDLEPAEFHYKIAEFKWRRLYTTNYDLLVESVYRNRGDRPKALQKLSLVYSDQNIKDGHKLKDNQLEYFKLHGCITRERDKDLPFVLTVDDFNDTLEDNRGNMLKTLYEIATSCPIVFVGHSNQDYNIRSILRKVRNDFPQGQRHYLIKPGAKVEEIRAWEEKKITILNMGFKEFLEELENSISLNERQLSLAIKKNDHPIQKMFVNHEAISHSLANLLDVDCQFVHEDILIGACTPEEFYKGNVKGWSGIQVLYAIERSLQKIFVRESFKKTEAERDEPFEFIVITGASGTGKTIFLRQLALASLKETTSVSLWVRDGSELDIESISELCSKTGERVYLYWDNLEINKKNIYNFIKSVKSRKLKVTIVGCERTNLWGSQCENLDEFSTKNYKLNRMSEDEIDVLLKKLQEFDVLSPYLKSLNHEDRCLYVKDKSERHLLVALYEITTGKRFEDIILDEFNRILPIEAQSIYQTICTLNKYGVAVRAGLLSRIHKIDFKEFGSRFLKPLENIIYPVSAYTDDIHYTSRHPEIAIIVDRYILNTPELRINEYLDIIKHINISYSVDEKCFKHLMKAKNMQDVFNNPENTLKVYEYAIENIPNNAYLYQQMALYLHKMKNHQLRQVVDLLLKAKEIEPYNSSILHSLYLVHKDNISLTDSEIKKESFTREAVSYINQMIEVEGKESSFSASARIDLNLKLLSYELQNERDPTKPYIQKKITDCQNSIKSFKLKYPEDTYSFEFDKSLTRTLKDYDGYVKAAKASYEQGLKTPDRAMTIAQIQVEEGDYDGAVSTLKEAIGDNRGNHKLHFDYAQLLRKHSPTEVSNDTLIYNYLRSYSPNDSNYIAQFWFARFAFLSEDKSTLNQALEVFKSLKSARTGSLVKREIRDTDKNKETSKDVIYHGTVAKVMYQHGFIELDQRDISIYFDIQNMVNSEYWELLDIGERLDFNIGYNYFGPIAINVTIA